ncbi:hypothetical protein Tco_0082940 [Tanacetum coccineum]
MDNLHGINDSIKVTLLDVISCMTQLMDGSSRSYQAFDSTLVGSSQIPYQRRTGWRIDGVSTLGATNIDDQPDL